MSLAVLTFVKKENIEKIKKEGFKPSPTKRTLDRRKKEAFMNASLGFSEEDLITYAIAVDYNLIGDVRRTARLHGELAILWNFHENSSLCIGDSLVGKGYKRVAPFSYKNFLEKKKEILLSREKYGITQGNCYIEVQVRDFDFLQMSTVIHEREIKEYL